MSVQMPGHGVVMASARALLTDWAQVARQSRAALDPASLRLDQGVLKTDGKAQQERREESEPRSGLRDERGKTWTNPRSRHNHSTISDLKRITRGLLPLPLGYRCHTSKSYTPATESEPARRRQHVPPRVVESAYESSTPDCECDCRLVRRPTLVRLVTHVHPLEPAHRFR